MLSENHDTEDECEGLIAIRQLRCSLAGCPYQTDRSHNLWRHQERHKRRPTETKDFCCPVCIYSSDKISNLKRHVAIRHSDAAPIEEDPEVLQPPADSRSYRIHCQVMGCRYGTNRAYDLKRHMLVHNNVEKSHKTYKCSLCMYSSDRKANLKRHLELRHSGIEGTIMTAYELKEDDQMLEDQTQREELLNGLIEDLDDVNVQVKQEEAKVEQSQAKIEYVYEQLDEVGETPLITISTCQPPILQGDISDKQVIAVNVNGQLRWFQSIDPPPGASSKLQLALEEQPASAQHQMDELDDELAMSLAEQDQEEELLVEMLTETQPAEKELAWSFHISNEKLETPMTPNNEGKQETQKEDSDFPIWWDDGEYTKMHKNQTFRDLRRKLSKANVQRILRDIYDIYYKPFKEERKQFEVFQIKDSWLCATRMTRMQIIKDMYSKQGT